MGRRLLLLVPLFLLASSSPARSGINHWSWDNCWSEQPVEIKNFACDVNTGQQVLVASFVPFEDHAAVVGFEALVYILSGTGTIPDWWRLGPGECRPNTASLAFNFWDMPQEHCLDAWSGQVLAQLDYAFLPGGAVLPPPGNIAPDAVKLSISAMVTGEPVSMQSGQEYYTFMLDLRNHKTTGSDACAGCDGDACIVLADLTIVDDGGYAEDSGGSSVAWRCGFFFPGHGLCEHSPDCLVATRNRTWGAIKSLYR